MKTKIALLNLLSNTLNRLFTIFVAIIIPKLYIDYFGSEVNGLLSSLSGIFVYLNLLEAGIGAASIQALYSPISQKRQEKIEGILTATNMFYKRSGVYFLLCISVVAFLYPIIVKSSIPFYTIVVIILLSAIPSCLTFFLQGKYNVLLQADNKLYILTTINMIFNLVSNIIKILLIINGYNLLTIYIVFAILCIFQFAAVLIYIKQKYPLLNFSTRADKEAISQKSSVLIHQICGVVFANTDVLILTVFFGLKVASVYTIYNMIFSQVTALPGVLSSSLTAGFGHLYTENKLKFIRLFNTFEVYYFSLIFGFLITAYILIIPFLNIYLPNVDDINYFDHKLAFLFLLVNILSTIRWPGVLTIEITGHFKQTSKRAVIEMVVNLLFSIVFVITIGMYGVLLGTIFALLYRTLDIIVYSNKYLLNRNYFISFKRIFLNIVIGVVIILLFKGVNLKISNYTEFLTAGFLIFLLVNIIYWVIPTIVEKEARSVIIEYLRIIRYKMVKRYIGN